MILDSTLIQSRRRELGLSQRQMAKTLGVTSRVVAAVEDGSNHHALTLDFASKLARALAVELADMLTTADAKASPDLELAASLGALLAETSTLTPVEALAEACDTSLEQVSAALDRLESNLEGTGLVLQRRTGEVALRSTCQLDPKQVKTLLRRHQARRGLKLTEARLLRDILDGDVNEARLSNPQLVALNRLRRAGLVTADTAPKPSHDVVLSLFLEPEEAAASH